MRPAFEGDVQDIRDESSAHPAAWQALRGEATYSDDALLEFILDQSDLSELEPSCRAAVENAMKHSTVSLLSGNSAGGIV